MDYTYHSNRKSDTGFIYVASRNRLYYELGILSATSLRDYHPEANITLFTHKNFIDDRAKIFDCVITDIPIHYRTKMWAMARTPYQRTLYNDCDSLINHRDIRKIHDFLDECDMFFGTCINYTVANRKWEYMDIAGKEPPLYHGSLCGYNKTNLTIDFMQTWWDKYLEQRLTPWPYGDKHYQEWQQFDMFTLWRMTSGKFKDEFGRFDSLKIKLLERRWNTTGQDHKEDIVGPRVITQVDKQTWSYMPAAWKIIEKGAKDEAYQVKQRKIDDPIIDFN